MIQVRPPDAGQGLPSPNALPGMERLPSGAGVGLSNGNHIKKGSSPIGQGGNAVLPPGDFGHVSGAFPEEL